MTMTIKPYLVVCILSAMFFETAFAQMMPTSSERLHAEAILAKGIGLHDATTVEENLYKEALKCDPSYAKPYFNLGLVYYDRKIFEVALTFFEKYVEFEPTSLAGLYQLAITYKNLNKLDKAQLIIKRYLSAKQSGKAVDLENEKQYTEIINRLFTTDLNNNHANEIIQLMDVYDNTSAREIVTILNRPRMRGNYRYDGPVYATTRIQFKKDSAVLLPDFIKYLDRVGEALNDDSLKNSAFEIDGHASSEGTKEHNKVLSEQRAEAVKAYLVKQCKIDPKRISVIGYGSEKPLIDPDKTERERECNRRVEFENHGKMRINADSNLGKRPQ